MILHILLTDNCFHSYLNSYNPVLWGVPKGSYASNPSGSSRIIEFRQMVQVYVCFVIGFILFAIFIVVHSRSFISFQALNCTGLRVVLDVVYNHLHASGPYDANSVLDKVMGNCLFSIKIYENINI